MKTKWDCNINDAYSEAFNIEHIANLNEKLDSIDKLSTTQEEVDELTKELSKMFIDPAKKIGISRDVCSKEKPLPTRTPSNVKSKPWFNSNCNKIRRDYLRIKNKLRKTKTDEAKIELKRQSNTYKRIIKKTRKSYNKTFISTLRAMKHKKKRKNIVIS